MYRQLRFLSAFLALLLSTGCAAIGPGTVQRDRIDYASALGSSWKEQTLLNIVKMRYLDTPVFLDVTSVVSMYELTGEVSVNSTIFPRSSLSTNYGLGASAGYAEWPTVSYAPLTGERYINSMLRPIPPKTILSMIEAGHPADFILQVAVRAINSVYNKEARPFRREDPVFNAVVAAFRRLQLSGALSARVEKNGDDETTSILFRREIGDETENDIRFLKSALGIAEDVDVVPVVEGTFRRGAGEIALLTRSMQTIFRLLSEGVEVPAQDLADGRATPSQNLATDEERENFPIAQIRSSFEMPIGAYAVARYRDHWFWIDDRDLASKRVFMFLMVFSSLAETGAAVQTPLIVRPSR